MYYDPRLEKLAQVIVNYSLEVKAGDLVLMAGEESGLPLMEAIYESLVKAGAHIQTQVLPSGWEEIFYRYASDEQLRFQNPLSLQSIEACHKRIRVIAPSNTRQLSNISSHKQTLVSQANRPILQRVLEKSARGELDWVVTLCPTVAGAQEASMGSREYADFVFQAAHLDEKDPVAFLIEMEKKQQLMSDYLSQKKELHFKTVAGTDLRVNIEGMKWKNSCGKRNFPDGEVFTGPAEKGVNGVVKYTYPAIWQNTVVENIELEFKEGAVCRAFASTNESFLRAMIEQDEGASRLGEIAIGTNYKIEKFTKNILFDEKIGGTFHAALGAGYPETGNSNQSALHWDMICDLREGGVIEADGEVISKDGQFLMAGWPNRS